MHPNYFTRSTGTVTAPRSTRRGWRWSLSENHLSTAANDARSSAVFSARKSPQRISENTPPAFPSLRPCIWPRLLRLATKGFSDRLLTRAGLLARGSSYYSRLPGPPTLILPLEEGGMGGGGPVATREVRPHSQRRDRKGVAPFSLCPNLCVLCAESKAAAKPKSREFW